MPGKAAKVVITERQQEMLRDIVRQRTASVGLIQRARIILMAFEGIGNIAIAIAVGLGRQAIGKWRRRWQRNFEKLVLAECEDGRAPLRKMIEHVLADAPRPGAPPTFTPEQVARIQALACEDPADSECPVTQGAQNNNLPNCYCSKCCCPRPFGNARCSDCRMDS